MNLLTNDLQVSAELTVGETQQKLQDMDATVLELRDTLRKQGESSLPAESFMQLVLQIFADSAASCPDPRPEILTLTFIGTSLLSLLEKQGITVPRISKERARLELSETIRQLMRPFGIDA